MITATDIREMGFLSASAVEAILRKDYMEDTILSANFLGISNGGQFAYQCRLADEDGEPRFAKVWLERNTLTGKIEADY